MSYNTISVNSGCAFVIHNDTALHFHFLNNNSISPEYDTLQVKWVFNNACGWNSNPQHILLGGKVGCLSDPIQ